MARPAAPRAQILTGTGSLNGLLDNLETSLAARHRSETQVRRFVADASHELRTPLASIRGYAELIRRAGPDLPPEISRSVGRIEAESVRMTGLIEDMLLLARLDAEREQSAEDTTDPGAGPDASLDAGPDAGPDVGPRPHAMAEVDLLPLVIDSVSDAHAADRDHHWHLDVGAGPASVTVRGVEPRLRQVLANLLANARLHTPPGTTVTSSLSRDDDTAVLSLSNDGPPIPADLIPRIFDRFARGDASRSTGSGSTGLGLAIVKAIVESHGGTCTVTSTSDRTTFTIRLPLTPGS